MELDEAIKYFQNKVMDLEAEFYDTTINLVSSSLYF